MKLIGIFKTGYILEIMSESRLLDTLHSLRSKTDQLLALRQSPDGSEQLENIYRTEVVPLLLQLRAQNRSEKDELESKTVKLKDLNQELVNLQEQCDCVIYEASCLGSEVEEVKQEACKAESPMKNGCDSFDPDTIGKLDHETRMRLLDEEETKRKDLVAQMSELESESKVVSDLTISCANQIKIVKPFIKQLIDKVTPSPLPSETEQVNNIKPDQ